jgi:hypothetical protein
VWRESLQIILLAVIAFLLHLLIRFQFFSGTQTANQSAFANDDQDEFELDSEEPADARIFLNTDINRRRCAGHFRVYSRFDTAVGQTEYQYRVDGTEVSIRVLQQTNEDIGVPKTWNIRDGVVQETEIRARWATEMSVLQRDVEADMAALKKRVEWDRLSSTDWDGLKYFILSKNMEKVDARRYFRQEIERIKLGVDLHFKEAAKLGLESDDGSLDRLRLAEGRQMPSNEEFKKLSASAETFGISETEFLTGQKLLAQLQQMVD